MLELAGIIILGILAQWVAWKLKIPAILPLILIGLLVGPIAAEYLSENGSKWIEPIWNGEKGLFPGEGLFYFVSLAISIILFEGGLTLKISEINNVGPVITKLITLGSVVTFFLGAISAHYLFDLGWNLSLLFASLIIVTGPTVISPILRNIPLKKDVAAVLKWEGILIDPIGALVAVLVFEFISVGGEGGFTQTVLTEFFKIVLFGTSLGFIFARALIFFVNRKFVPHYLLNVVSLSIVLLVFVLSDLLAHESGLLAVVVMGMVIANSKLKSFDELLYFKESLTVLLISILFILLAANMNMSELELIFNWKTIVLFALVVFVVRPLGVFISTHNSTLKLNEKLFISWVGPRGIVAAGIASLFGTKLMKQGIEGAQYITPLVFIIVLGTVLLNATTARMFAKMIGVFLKKSEAIVFVGASHSARLIAKFLIDNNRRVILLDSNKDYVNDAKEMGIEAFNIDIYNDNIDSNVELNDVGYLIAMTGSDVINKYALERFSSIFGEMGAYRLATSREVTSKKPENSDTLFTQNDDFINLTETIRDYPKINELKVTSSKDFQEKVAVITKHDKAIPLFLKSNSQIKILAEVEDQDIKENDVIVYVGEEVA
ncbi:sodium/proton antiporter (CPA1 family) [Tenacibaculum skagerrakense]|uniref:Sodium/proton antiporter (CPA1 family) n=1 Tax=Tenacibaculum skagerrakense TaxID=186571 RepID=A0A4R2NPP8_9FLAO|nr:cation:proton antiporter [Tenacibaculum skagerrakense]TCP23338.1 sodium/proton antiporter (CPA1 family) [Tenacibaculum skagerrakense]